ncbi:MAG: methyltransferase domain-containing protein [bacterium]|nr:methyltransferase domain-containing protein [bacterium]
MIDNQDKTQEVEHGKKIANSADFIWGWGTLVGQIRANRRADYLISLADIKPGKKVLEVGCGTGIFTEKLATTGAEIFAIDISSDLLSKAENRIKSSKVTFKEADLEALPFEEGAFDCVVGVSVLHHVNIEKALREIKRVLKKPGIMVFSEPNMMNPQIALQKNIPWLKKLAGDTPDETAFFRWPIKKLLIREGLADAIVKPFDFLHPKTPLGIINIAEKFGLILEKIPLIRELAGSLLIVVKS